MCVLERGSSGVKPASKAGTGSGLGVVVAVDEAVLRRCTGRHGQRLEGRSGRRLGIGQGWGLGKADRPLVKAVMEMRWMAARCGVDAGA